MSIEWKGGAVCYASKMQHLYNEDMNGVEKYAHTYGDFQLNEMREGDYIEASELDTEQKYNDAVAVFGLFGFESDNTYVSHIEFGTNFYFIENGEVDGVRSEKDHCKRKITYQQLMAIGKLKRAMIERDEVERAMSKCTCKQCMRGLENYCMVELKTPPLDVSGFNTVEQSRDKRARRNKSKQAYEILKSLDYEYDLDKQQWYKKEWV